MEKFTGLSFSLTKGDIKVLLSYKNSDEIRKKVNSLSFSIRTLFIITILSALISILHISFFGLALIIMIISGCVSAELNRNLCIEEARLEMYDNCIGQLKLDFQRLVGANRFIDDKTFRLEKSNNVKNNLTSYPYVKKGTTYDLGFPAYRVISANAFIGTVSTQYVAVDDNGIIGAINELKLSDVERSATENGCVEKIVTKYEYSLCGADEVRPYKPEVFVKKRTRKPQGR